MIDAKLPPQNIELEKAILGALLIEADAIYKAINLIHEDCFYVEANKHVWNAIIALYRASQPIDTLTVDQQLRKSATHEIVGGYGYIVTLTNSIGSAANIENHCFSVKECYLRRKLISITTRTNAQMFDDTVDFFEGMDKMLTEVESINREINRIQQVNFSDAVYDRLAQLKEAGQSKTYRTGVTTQLEALDRQTMGFQPTDLIIIAARPAMGKTALIVDFMRHQGLNGISAGFFSLEMSMQQIIDRMFSSGTEIDLKQIKRGGMSGQDWQRMDNTTIQMAEYPIYICDKGGLSINDVVSIAKGWKIKHDIKILYIDYLQLISGTFKKQGNREQEISEVSRRLKQLANSFFANAVCVSLISSTIILSSLISSSCLRVGVASLKGGLRVACFFIKAPFLPASESLDFEAVIVSHCSFKNSMQIPFPVSSFITPSSISLSISFSPNFLTSCSLVISHERCQ